MFLQRRTLAPQFFLSAIMMVIAMTASVFAQTRIMPLGDSNTRGKSGANYRSYLRNSLINQAAFPMNYVGSGVAVGGAHGPGGDSGVPYSSTEISALGGDLEHEGWGGYTIDGLRAGAGGWIAAANPDMILLMVGTNDFNNGIGAGAIDRLDALIGEILALRPGVTLVVGSIPPGRGTYSKWTRTVTEFNSQIPGLVNDYASEGYKTYFANIFPALNPETDLIDSLHPNSAGYQKVAGAWYEVVSQLAAGNSQPQVTFTASGSQTAGYFVEGGDLTLSAQTFDADGTVATVKFFANGVQIGETSGEPHTLNWRQVARGPYKITAVAYDNEGFPGYSYPLDIRVGEPLPRAIVVVGGGGGLLEADYKISDSLAALGLEAEFYADAEVAGGLGDAELIVISSTVSSSQVGTVFKNSTLPVITCEPFLFDDMGLTAGLRGVDFELSSNQTSIQITDPLHPLAAGLGAGVTPMVTNGQGFFSWGRPAGNVFSVGHLPGFPDRSAIFGIETGGLLFGGVPAAGRRVGLFLGDSTAINFTTAGQNVLNASIVWALNGAVGGPTGGGANLAPRVGVDGGDRFLVSGLPASTTLNAWVLDDGRPLGNPLVVGWTAGEPGVGFSNPASPTTGVTFSAYGSFLLTVTVTDGEFSASKNVTVTVVDPNGPPAGLAYSSNPATYEAGSVITPNTPSSLGSAVSSYAIDPPLPAGLELDPVTGIISGTPSVAVASATYVVTATNTLGSTTAALVISVQLPPAKLLLVVGNLTFNAGDSAIYNWFATRRFVITLKTLASVQAADAVGQDLIMITATGSSNSLGNRLRDVAVPTIVCEPYLFGAMGMTGVTSNSALGNSTGETQLVINEPSHPLAAGLDATVNAVTTGSGFFGWGIPAETAINIASLASNSFHSGLFAYDQGSSLVNGTPAPHRRLGMFLGDLTAANLTSDGYALFNAGVQWALLGGGFGPGGPPVQLTYSRNPAVYVLGGEISPNVPSLRGGVATSFSITPELPSGLVFDNVTGIISGTPTESRVSTVYQVTAFSSAGATSRSITISVPGMPLGEVLMVVGNVTLNSGDSAIRNWFEAAGYSVTLRSLSAVQTADTVGKSLVMITSTGSSAQIGARLRDVKVPTIVCEAFIFDDMGMTAAGDNVLLGSNFGESRIQISDPGSPLAAGLSGTVDVTTTGDGFFSWGVPGGAGLNIAGLSSNPARSAIFAYEVGSLLASGQVAPQRRLGMFMGDFTATNFTAAGWQIFGACVDWAVNGPEFDPDGPPAQLEYSANPGAYVLGAEITPNVPTSVGGPADSYSISPALPAGLTLNSVTGVITGTPEETRLETNYQVSAINQKGSTATTLVISIQGPPLGDVLLVVGSLTLTSGDAAIRDWFEDAGYTVTLQSFAAVQPADAVDKELVMISATGISSELGGRLTNVPVPMIVCDSFVFDDMGLTGFGDGFTLGFLNTQSQIGIVRPEHPLAAGLNGLQTVVNNPEGYFTWGVMGGQGFNVATLASDANKSTIFAYESGGILASGQPAAHRRLGLYLGDFTAANFTGNGSRLLAASVQWTINGTGFDTNGPPLHLTYSASPAIYNQDVPVMANVPSSLGGAVDGYSIIPALPAGLSFDTLTGIISGTPTVSQAVTAYQVTAFNAAGSTRTTLNLSVLGAQLPKVLLVVGSLTLNSGDTAIRAWFESAGYSVTLKTLTAVQPADTVGQDFVMITSTGSAGQIGSRLSDVPVPVIVCEPYIFGSMGMTLSGTDVDMGISLGQTQLDVVAPSHPLAAGLSGITTVVGNSSGFFPWGVPGAQAVKIANLTSDPLRSPLFAYEAGSLLASGLPAPNRRIGLFLGDVTAANFTPQGLQLFAAAVQWAYDGRNFDENGAPARLQYSRNRAAYPLGVPIAPNVPSVLGGPVVGYAISPPLPAGLAMDPVTGVISGTPTGIPLTSTFKVTAYNQFGATSTNLTLARDMLLVVGSLSLNAGDTSLRNWFHSAGYVVTLRTLTAAQAADAVGKDLVMITATGTSTQLGSRLRDVPVPVIVCESGLFDDMGITGVGEGVNSGNQTAQTQMNIRTPAHPLAAGLTGLTTVIGGASQVFNWGVPGSEAVNVASLTTNTARSTLFGYDIGSRLVTGQTVAHRRLGMFLHDLTPSRLNTQGLQLLAAAVRWAIEGLPQNTQPFGLSYSSNPAFYNLGVAITPNIPTPVGGLPTNYSIAPLLPAGMILNPTTGVISGTPTVVKKETRYQVTASNSSGSSSTTLTLSVEGPGDVLLVAGSLSLNAGDQAVRDWFVARGYSVTTRTLAEVQAADTTGNDLVVITSTGTSGQIGSRLRDVTIPVIVSEPYSFANMGMTLTGDNVQMGIANLETQIDVIGSSHPLAAGLAGLTTVANNSGGFLSWGIPGSGAEKIATLATDSTRSPLFAYELGSLMASGQRAPGRRVGLFLGDLTAASLTPQGLQLFSAAVQWALEEPVFDVNGPPVLLRYMTNPAVYPLNSRITPNLPSSMGGAVSSYSIMPALPVGLVLDPVTGIISGKPKEVKPPTTYLVTATNAAGSTTLQLPLSIQGPPPGDVLLVVGNSSLNAGDAALRNWFLAGGYTVTVRTLSAVQATDTVGMELVMITSTGTAGQISTRLRDVAVPVIVCEPFAFGNMRMTLPGDNVQMGFASNEAQISVAASSHPLTAGLGGLTTVVSNSAGFFGWGVPGIGASNIATLVSNSSRSALFAYESGSPLATGDVAPHRRLGMFMGDLTAANLTLEGSWILAAAVDWAIKGIVVVVPDPPPNPPVGLSYAANPATYQVGGAITPNVPTSQGGLVQNYSITPALPAGLVFNTTTGVISGTPTAITAATAYQVTASNEDGSTSATLNLSVPGPPEVMLVVGSLTLNTGDTALRNWFLTRGYVVTMRSFAAAQAADATGKNLVVVSSTGTSSQLAGRLTNVAVPVIVCESAIFDDMGMTAVGDGVQHGSLNTQSQIQIVSSGHPLAAGLSGLTTVVSNSAGFFQWGVPGSAAVNVATLASNPARSTLFAYESGSILVSGQAAAHRRLGLFLGDFTAANFTASGSQIFEACVQWAVGQR